MMTTNYQILDQNVSFTQLRPLNLQQDLAEVADLIELCFSKTLDRDGRRYISQIREAAKNPSILGFPNYMGHSFAGFVWEEEGVVVGNISLIPIQALQQRAYLIANVAVHPEYRLRGIARYLTNAALTHIKNRKVHSVWLQVNSDNPVAIHLYHKMGFLERARRTTWHSQPNIIRETRNSHSITITPQRKKDWALQREWLQRIYPEEVSWHLPIKTTLLMPGFVGNLKRLFNEQGVKQWTARLENQLIGTLSWQSSTGMADWLWLATTPAYEEKTIQALLPHALESLKRNRLLSINYMAGEGVDAFQKAGFKNHRTLIWMHLTL